MAPKSPDSHEHLLEVGYFNELAVWLPLPRIQARLHISFLLHRHWMAVYDGCDSLAEFIAEEGIRNSVLITSLNRFYRQPWSYLSTTFVPGRTGTAN